MNNKILLNKIFTIISILTVCPSQGFSTSDSDETNTPLSFKTTSIDIRAKSGTSDNDYPHSRPKLRYMVTESSFSSSFDEQDRQSRENKPCSRRVKPLKRRASIAIIPQAKKISFLEDEVSNYSSDYTTESDDDEWISPKKSIYKKKRAKIAKASIKIQTEDKLAFRTQQLYDEHSHNNDFFLRPYQKTMLKGILASLKKEKTKIAIQMPTGTGKTAVFSKLISLLQDGKLPCKIIVAVPTTALVEQTVEKLNVYSKNLPSLKQEIGKWYQNKKNIEPITVTTLQSLTQHWQRLSGSDYKSGKNWDDTDDYFHPHNPNSLIIIDEAHRTNGDAIRNIMKEMPKAKHVIGFSASLIDYNELPLEIVSILEFKDAIKVQAISGVQFMDIDFSYHHNLNFLRKSLNPRGKDLSPQQLEAFDRLLNQTSGISSTVAQIVKNLFVDDGKHRKIMIFTNTKIHAENLQKIFSLIDVGSVAVHGGMNLEEKNKNINLFRSETSNKDIMISCGVLDEGFDLPLVKVVVDFGIYINKPRRLIQRLGRATRLEGKISAKYLRVKILPDDSESPQLNPSTMGLLGPKGEYISHLGVDDYDKLQWHVPFGLEEIINGDKEILPYEAKLKFPDSEKLIVLGKDGSFREEDTSGPIAIDEEFELDEEFQSFLDELFN